MSRLKRIIAMDMNAFQGTINQTSQKGRDILKSLEDFKFTLEQTARLLNNNQELAQGMIKKRKSIDEISGKLYQIVFDIENMDISESFNNQQQPVMTDAPNVVPGQEQPPANAAGPGQPPVPGAPTPGIPGTPTPGGAPVPGGGGSAPSGGSGGAAPGGAEAPGGKENDKDKGDKGDNEEETKPEDTSDNTEEE